MLQAIYPQHAWQSWRLLKAPMYAETLSDAIRALESRIGVRDDEDWLDHAISLRAKANGPTSTSR